MSEQLKAMGSKRLNAYEECWGSLKDIISNNRCIGLSSDSNFAYGLRTAYDDMYFLMNMLERICGVEKNE